MEQDKEISAMASISLALADLDAEAISRVLRWAADRYNIGVSARGQSTPPRGNSEPQPDSQDNRNQVEFHQFSDFFDATDPTTEADRVLVAAYWFQIIKGTPELESQSLNTELKNTGHGISHMPHILDDLMKAKPRLVIQLKKQGTTQQARRKFKLTTEGIKKVKGMLPKEG